MRLPPRWLVACSVVGSLAASGTAVLVLPERALEARVVELPSFDGVQTAPAPTAAGPAVTGRQIADLAATPARRRAEELAPSATPRPVPRATPQPSAQPSPTPSAEPESKRDRIKKACQDGRMKGRVCKGR